jgi:hypothetical protein
VESASLISLALPHTPVEGEWSINREFRAACT